MVEAFESVSTWKQPLPPPASLARVALVCELAATVDALGSGRLRVAVDGFTASGKTSFAHELAAELRNRCIVAGDADETGVEVVEVGM